MVRDRTTALEGIAGYIEERIDVPAREVYARLVEVDDIATDIDAVTSIFAEFAMSIMALTLESLEANGVDMIGR
ncbi:MAG: hypothetical protein WEE66_00035 [Actinomycetota bacterium]